MKVHSRNHYTLTIFLEINQKNEIEQKRKLNKNGSGIKIQMEVAQNQKWKFIQETTIH